MQARWRKFNGSEILTALTFTVMVNCIDTNQDNRNEYNQSLERRGKQLIFCLKNIYIANIHKNAPLLFSGENLLTLAFKASSLVLEFFFQS